MKKLVFLFVYFFLNVVAQSQTDTVSALTTENEKLIIDARANELATIAWEKLEKGDFTGAINTCKEGLMLDSTNLFLLGNLAHAYLFNGNYDEAIEIYRQNLGKVFDSGMSWREMIKQDFEAFKAKGFDSKRMDKVIKDSVLSLE